MKTDMKTKMSSFSFGNGQTSLDEAQASVQSSGPVDIESRVGDLEARPTMPAASSGVEGSVLALDAALRPRWDPNAGFPAATDAGSIAVYDGTTWEVKAPPEKNSFVLFDVGTDTLKYVETPDISSQFLLVYDSSANDVRFIEIPTTDGKTFLTLETAVSDAEGDNVLGKLDYIPWR